MVLPRALYQQPVLVRLMISIGLLILPGIAWVDYQQGYYFSAGIELAAAAILICLIGVIRPLGARRAARLTLLAPVQARPVSYVAASGTKAPGTAGRRIATIPRLTSGTPASDSVS